MVPATRSWDKIRGKWVTLLREERRSIMRGNLKGVKRKSASPKERSETGTPIETYDPMDLYHFTPKPLTLAFSRMGVSLSFSVFLPTLGLRGDTKEDG
jgi:hypothetical protein